MKALLRLLIASMVLTMTMLTASARPIKVTGTVYDQDKNPIPMVTIVVKNSNKGTMANLKGKYEIQASKGDTLVYSSIGYKTAERVAQGTRIDVQLQEDTQKLEEMIVIIRGAARQMGEAVQQGFRSIGRHFEIPQVEEYSTFKENGFLSPLKEPLSTFSLDVDAASYSNVRRMINQGKMPEKDAVRVEEMINYFSYDYPKPTGKHPVNIVAEATTCPWNSKHQIVRIGIKAKEITSQNLPASNFVFLIDASGSMMDENKLPLVKSSLKLLLNNLRPSDRVAIVAYAGAAGEVLPSTSAEDKQKIIDALQNLSAGGSTAGGQGIELAYKIAQKNFIKGGNNRLILCTDGDFNVGISSTEELEALIEQKRKSGVYLTVLGYGMGNYKDNKLQVLAQKGNGNHAYVDNIQEANKVLVHEFGSTMYTVAKDVKLQVEFNPALVNTYRLIGYETRLLDTEDFNDDTKDAGEIGAGHTVTAMYEIVPTGVEVPTTSVDKLKYQEPITPKAPTRLTNSTELLTIKLRYKKPDETTSRLMEVPLKASATTLTPSPDLNFAMSVAMFGQLLRDSQYKGTATYGDVIRLARKGISKDPNGYRHEFIRLVESVDQIQK